MISRRNFLSITTIIFVILFMFQLSGVVKEYWNDYGENQYAEASYSGQTSDTAFSPETVQVNYEKDYVIYVGDVEEGSLSSVIKQWCTYTKRRLISYPSISEVEISSENPPEALLLNSEGINWNTDMDRITSFVENNINLIFCNLPPTEVIAQNQALQTLLGINYIWQKDTQLTGIKLFSGFLIGGEEIYAADKPGEERYQDMDLSIPWYSVDSGTKKYMVGLLEDEEHKDISNEYLPAIIWRNSVGVARVFAVNGDYLNINSGIGILDAMMAELNEYELYPVVNSQMLVALNYPVVAVENDSEINRRYSRLSDAVFLNVIWPDLISLATRKNAPLTCLMNLQLDYADQSEPDSEKMKYYFKLISEQKGEVGLSGSQITSLPLKEKTEKDYEFIMNTLPNYQFMLYYVDKLQIDEITNQKDLPLLKNVRTILTDYNATSELISYASNSVLQLEATADGFSHSFSEDLRQKSLETALGYSAIVVDMERVLYPKSDKDGWEYLYNEFSRFTSTYWKRYSDLEWVTLSEGDKRARDFLAMDYSDRRSEDSITLHIDHFSGEGWFILRTHDEDIAFISGGSSKKLEDNAFLIHAEQENVIIKLGKAKSSFFQPNS